GLIAVSGVGRYLYALGYFGHRLYQYEFATGSVRFVDVGSVGGHISRNLLSDHRGHAYVPRLRPSQGVAVTLVEYDESLREAGETAIGHYLHTTPLDSHGIVGFQYLADRSIVFVTNMGFLYRVRPGAGGDGAAEVRGLGWFHPDGAAYVPS